MSQPTTGPVRAQPPGRPLPGPPAPAAGPVLSPVEADREIISAAGFALVKLNPERYAHDVADQAAAAHDEPLRERLIYLLGLARAMSPRRRSRRCWRERRDYPSPATLLAAGKLGLAEVDQPVRKILLAWLRRTRKACPWRWFAPRFQAAGDLPAPLPAGEELENFCNKLWYPRGGHARDGGQAPWPPASGRQRAVSEEQDQASGRQGLRGLAWRDRRGWHAAGSVRTAMRRLPPQLPCGRCMPPTPIVPLRTRWT